METVDKRINSFNKAKSLLVWCPSKGKDLHQTSSMILHSQMEISSSCPNNPKLKARNRPPTDRNSSPKISHYKMSLENQRKLQLIRKIPNHETARTHPHQLFLSGLLDVPSPNLHPFEWIGTIVNIFKSNLYSLNLIWTYTATII